MELFDYTSQYQVGDTLIDYGCISGNEKIVFIKVGLGGNYLGYDNKYLQIAQRLYEQCGCSVISVSNPNDKKCGIDVDRDIIFRFIKERGISNPQLYFIGHSNGSLKGIELAASGVNFQRMLLINMPLMINFHKTKKWISAIPATELVMIFGAKDPSFPYVPFLDGKYKNVKIQSVPQADHNFEGMLDEFITLADFIMK